MPGTEASPPVSPASAESSPRGPNSRRGAAAAAAASARLSTIVEGQARNRSSADRTVTTPPPLPVRSPWRALAYTAASRSPWSSTASSLRTAPPAYEWVSNPSETAHDPRAPVEGEKVAALRRGEVRQYRGGWRRLALIFAAVALIVIALAVGLGVGLTVGRRQNSNNASDDSSVDIGYGNMPGTNVSQRFPLGEYSLITTLRTVSTDCTSNPATWRCYPYSTYDPSNLNSINPSTAIFNWIITNTSNVYALNRTSIKTSTPESGEPANLTISSTSNPFSLVFDKQNLMYHATAGNASSAYYSFSFVAPKQVIPTSPLTSDGLTSTCFFNQTTLTARLYLQAPPSMAAMANSSAFGGGYTPWPYALVITQNSPSGEDVPACYSPNWTRINTNATTPVMGDRQCTCEYRNY